MPSGETARTGRLRAVHDGARGIHALPKTARRQRTPLPSTTGGAETARQTARTDRLRALDVITEHVMPCQMPPAPRHVRFGLIRDARSVRQTARAGRLRAARRPHRAHRCPATRPLCATTVSFEERVGCTNRPAGSTPPSVADTSRPHTTSRGPARCRPRRGRAPRCDRCRSRPADSTRRSDRRTRRSHRARRCPAIRRRRSCTPLPSDRRRRSRREDSTRRSGPDSQRSHRASRCPATSHRPRGTAPRSGRQRSCHRSRQHAPVGWGHDTPEHVVSAPCHTPPAARHSASVWVVNTAAVRETARAGRLGARHAGARRVSRLATRHRRRGIPRRSGCRDSCRPEDSTRRPAAGRRPRDTARLHPAMHRPRSRHATCVSSWHDPSMKQHAATGGQVFSRHFELSPW